MDAEKEPNSQSEPAKSPLEIAKEFYGGGIPDFKPSSSVTERAYQLGSIGNTADGILVKDRNFSHFHRENGITPETIKAAIQTIDTKNRAFIEECIEFDHPIGFTHCVEVKPDDTVISVYRKGRSKPIPMVLGRDPEPCNKLCVVLLRTKIGKGPKGHGGETIYQLVTAFAGNQLATTPDDPHIKTEEERKRCLDFWSKHALVFDPGAVDWNKTKKITPGPKSESNMIDLKK